MTIEQLRQKNRQTIRQFLEQPIRLPIGQGQDGQDDRTENLFADPSCVESEDSRNGQKRLATEAFSQWAARLAGLCIEFSYINNIIFEGDDPDRFLVKSVWLDKISDNSPIEYRKAFVILEFLLANGRIVRLRETPNPCEILMADA
jgi:hypothetical protein